MSHKIFSMVLPFRDQSGMFKSQCLLALSGIDLYGSGRTNLCMTSLLDNFLDHKFFLNVRVLLVLPWQEWKPYLPLIVDSSLLVRTIPLHHWINNDNMHCPRSWLSVPESFLHVASIAIAIITNGSITDIIVVAMDLYVLLDHHYRTTVPCWLWRPGKIQH